MGVPTYFTCFTHRIFEAYIKKISKVLNCSEYIPYLDDISVWLKLKKPACFTFLIISGKIKIWINEYFILLLCLIIFFYLISTKELFHFCTNLDSGSVLWNFLSEFRSRLEAHPAIYQLIIELINHSIQCLGSV